MPVNRGPGVRQIGAIGTTPKEHRLALAGQYAENAPGVPRSGLLVQASVNVVTPTATTGTMTYLVAEVAAVIARTVGEGVYTPTTVGATIANRTVPTANAPATGSRWDLVWIKQNDQEKGDADNSAILGVTSGTAQASPVRPTGTVPTGALVLSEHQIFSGTASTTASPNTTTQLWRHTAARGAPIPIRSDAELAEITTPAIGQRAARLDLTGTTDTWNGNVWERDRDYSNWITTDANWTYGGGLLKTIVNGRTFIQLIGIMYRQSGGSFTVAVGTDVSMGVYIPTGWRPSIPISAMAPVTTGTVHNGEPAITIAPTGALILHATVSPVTIAPGAHISYNVGWYL